VSKEKKKSKLGLWTSLGTWQQSVWWNFSSGWISRALIKLHLLVSKVILFKSIILFITVFLFYFIILTFTYMCIHYVGHLLPHPPASRQKKFCAFVLQFCWRENIRDHKKNIVFC
jgi:hypothetical protein